MSNYVVIARFDEDFDQRFIHLRNLLKDAGYAMPEWPPHITIAAYEDLDAHQLCEWACAFASNHRRLKIGLVSLSILPPWGDNAETAVLCLQPAYSKSFVDFYYAFHECYEEYCTGIGWFNSIAHGNPVIHSTIGVINKNELQKSLDIVFSSDIFGYAEIIALEVYTYPMKLIQRFDLPL